MKSNDSQNSAGARVRAPRKTKAASAKPAPQSIESHQVARRAYEIFLERGGGHGNELDDWLRAERELASTSSPKRPSRKRTKAS